MSKNHDIAYYRQEQKRLQKEDQIKALKSKKKTEAEAMIEEANKDILSNVYKYLCGGAYKQAMTMLEYAAMMDDPNAMIALGTIYESGYYVEKDPAKAFSLYQKAWQKDLPAAAYRLGACYLGGIGVEADEAKGLELFENAALRGNYEAREALHHFYSEGIHVEKDLEIAAFFRQKR